ncbi:hypothetical protein BZA05DRAFT_392589 [Tricharina praecox]|uniref:uncharacterized protein n=1 Tax=Tricharina praecox TaxID=43433 RepID=UPI00221E9A68|nr:uncharacterized protein BZA05DRAFT_392589 [Tricharina praecox]KAI5854798.1 hypothetical protein BZA05DRAFT_392589 [Tricharina praecox]
MKRFPHCYFFLPLFTGLHFLFLFHFFIFFYWAKRIWDGVGMGAVFLVACVFFIFYSIGFFSFLFLFLSFLFVFSSFCYNVFSLVL